MRVEESAREKKRTRFEIGMWVIIEEVKKKYASNYNLRSFVREGGRKRQNNNRMGFES